MVTIQDLVAELVSQDASARSSREQGILNLSAYAKQIQPELEKYLLRPIKINSIVAALRRLPTSAPSVPLLFDRDSYLRIYAPVFVMTVLKTSQNLSRLAHYQVQSLHDRQYFNVVAGEDRVTVVAASLYFDEFDAVFKNQLRVIREAGVVVLKITSGADETPSLFYHLTREMHQQHISILEMLTSADQVDFVLGQKDVMLAGEAFRKRLQERGKGLKTAVPER